MACFLLNRVGPTLAQSEDFEMLKVGDHAIHGEEAYGGLVAGTGTPAF